VSEEWAGFGWHGDVDNIEMSAPGNGFGEL
jgi:hypothetical protein